MSYDVVILRRAEEQLAEIATWISKRSLDGAARWLDAFDAAIGQLRENPLSSSLAPEDEFVETEIRHVFFKTRRGATYRALFMVKAMTSTSSARPRRLIVLRSDGGRS